MADWYRVGLILLTVLLMFEVVGQYRDRVHARKANVRGLFLGSSWLIQRGWSITMTTEKDSQYLPSCKS